MSEVLNNLARERDALVTQMQTMLAASAALDAKIAAAKLAEQPLEPDMGSVVTFTKLFTGSKPYPYAGIRTPKGWSLTGKTTMNGIKWQAVLTFIKHNESDPDWALATLRKWHEPRSLAKGNPEAAVRAMDDGVNYEGNQAVINYGVGADLLSNIGYPYS